MKYTVLTLTPPWGTLVALGVKKIETRSWETEYRGKLLIHQGSNLKPAGGMKGLLELCGRQPFFDALYPIVPGADRYCDKEAIVAHLPMGKLLCSVDLFDIYPIVTGAVDTIPELQTSTGWVPVFDPERSFGDYRPGRFGWMTKDVKRFAEPIPARGYQKLWTWEGEL